MMNKILKIAGLIIGFSSVMCNTLILLFNKTFFVGLKEFIPEGNQFIRIPEIVMGFVGIIILSWLILECLWSKK